MPFSLIPNTSFLIYLKSVLKHLIFLLLLFAIGRIIFLVVNSADTTQIKIREIVAVFPHALRLDYATASYLMIIPFLLLTFELMLSTRWLNLILQGYQYIILLIINMLYFSDAFLYKEWSQKINYKALLYLQHPDEILKTATWSQTIVAIGGIILLSLLFILIYRKWILSNTITKVKYGFIKTMASLFIGIPILFIGMRGGISHVNISQSASYYSKYQILNDAAVNTPYNLFHSILKNRKDGNSNRFKQIEDSDAKTIVHNLYITEKDSSLVILKQKPVNIVFILLESWSADLIASLGGEPGITPYFAELEKEGLLLTQMYANGHRSQQGISVLLSGFPPVPVHNITDDFSKYPHLNSIVRDLKTAGYSSAFYFGGDLTYGNIKSYIMAQQFDKVIDEHDLPSSYPRGKLSIPDQYLFEYQLHDTKNLKEPFFSMIFTGSSHSPYDQPKIGEQLTWDVDELPYLNSAKYSDFALGEYLKKVRHESWYPRTLFVLIADHSHKTYRQWDYNSAAYQHIPMLLWGEVVKEEYRGKQWHKMVSQVDVPATLLKQLGLPIQKYEWSMDIFNCYTQQFVPVETYTGLNWITPSGFIAYNADNHLTTHTFTNDSLFNVAYLNCIAFLQVLYDSYLDK